MARNEGQQPAVPAEQRLSGGVPLRQPARRGPAFVAGTVTGALLLGGGYGLYQLGAHNAASPDANPGRGASTGADNGTTDTRTNAGTEQNSQYFHPKESWPLTALAKDYQLNGVPTYQEVLNQHGLTESNTQKVELKSASWEPGITAVELTPENYGKVTIDLLPGYVYTVDSVDGDKVYWGGDPKVKSITLNHGFTARYMPAYLDPRNVEAHWLTLDDPTELMVREVRDGRYHHNQDMIGVLPNVPYFGRLGPFNVLNGNLDLKGWVPPTIDATVAKDYRDAAAMFGGYADASAWKFGEPANGGYLNWAWTSKGATVDWEKAAKWQTVYAPQGGYTEIWLTNGTIGPDGRPVTQDKSYRFDGSTQTNKILATDHNVDEFSIHTRADR